jgi:predicted DCC family thiol-disulfide oxidoreductase YuxK
MRAHDRAGRVSALPNQTPGLLTRFGLSREQVDAAAWSVDADDHKLRGAAAINRVLRELGGSWRFVSRLYDVPLIGPVEEAGYRLIAKSRPLLSRWYSSVPECDRPEVDCE